MELVLPLPFGLAASDADRDAPSVDTDGALVRACQRGDREAFDRLVERYQRGIYRLCYRYVNHHEDASDLAQEAFLKAWRAIGRFRGDSSFATWLYRIAVNACLNHRALAAAVDSGAAREPARPGARRRGACAPRRRGRARAGGRRAGCPTSSARP